MTFLLIGAIVVPLIGVPVVYWFSLLLKYRAGYVASLLSIVPLAAVLIAGFKARPLPKGPIRNCTLGRRLEPSV